jgi:hypothetical protein
VPLTFSCQRTITLAGKPARLPRGCSSQTWYICIKTLDILDKFAMGSPQRGPCSTSVYYASLYNDTFCLSFSGPNMMYLFNSTEWCYIKRTTDNALHIFLQASRWRVKTENTIVTFSQILLQASRWRFILVELQLYNVVTSYIRRLDSDWLTAVIFFTNSGLAMWICRICASYRCICIRFIFSEDCLMLCLIT